MTDEMKKPFVPNALCGYLRAVYSLPECLRDNLTLEELRGINMVLSYLEYMNREQEGDT